MNLLISLINGSSLICPNNLPRIHQGPLRIQTETKGLCANGMLGLGDLRTCWAGHLHWCDQCPAREYNRSRPIIKAPTSLGPHHATMLRRSQVIVTEDVSLAVKLIRSLLIFTCVFASNTASHTYLQQNAPVSIQSINYNFLSQPLHIYIWQPS